MTRETRRLLVGILAVLLIVNGAAALQTVQSFAADLALGVAYPPALRLFGNVVWALVFAGLIVAMYRRPRRAIRWTAPLLSIYGALNVFSLLLFARTNFDRGRIPFQALLTVILLLPIWWLGRKRRAARVMKPTAQSRPESRQKSPKGSLSPEAAGSADQQSS